MGGVAQLAAATAWLDEPLVALRSGAADERRDGLREAAWQVLGQMLQLAAGAEVVALRPSDPQGRERKRQQEQKPHGDRLAWRPAREKTAWKVRAQAERWEAWKAGRDAVVLGTR